MRSEQRPILNFHEPGLAAIYGFSGENQGGAGSKYKVGIMNNESMVCAPEAEIEPRVAAVELLPTFRVLARGLCPKDRHLQEDLMQEMALATLQCATARSASSFCVVALWRAKNYLEAWNEQSKRPGCVVNSQSVDDPRRKALEEEQARLAAEKAEAALANMAQKKAG